MEKPSCSYQSGTETTSEEFRILEDNELSYKGDNCPKENSKLNAEHIDKIVEDSQETTDSVDKNECFRENIEDERKENTQRTVKKNYCFYCKKLFSKITPHLERIHHNEKYVKMFAALPKGSRERKQIIDTIRKQGNFIFNRENNDNLIVCRRKKDKHLNKNAYMVCANCKGYFSKTALRKHYRYCANKKDKKKGVLVLSRKLDFHVHEKACTILRKKVLPVLKNDIVSKIIRQDEFLIRYGNKMCSKYRSPHLYKMIRSRLRFLARFLLEMKKIRQEIKEFTDVFYPQFYHNFVEVINIISGLDIESGEYRSPATAFNLGILLKQCTTLYISLCIQEQEPEKQARAKDLLKVLKEDIGTSVNKTVVENQKQRQRRKKISLPEHDDVKCLNEYLTRGRRECFTKLKAGFTFQLWKDLASYCLTSLQLFNRRRAGEMERVLIEDFLNFQCLDENRDKEILETFPEECQKAAKNYVRFLSRGKLGRSVPVLVHKEILNYLECNGNIK